jgi:glycosyltransferase involved in cell wall biosynthesis
MRLPVSAVLPIKDGQEWIPEALLEISNLLESQDELIIIDDHSTDSTWEILEGFSCQPSLRTIKNPGVGLVSALNEGITIAQHDWIARFDIDDKYRASRVDKQLAAITQRTVAIFTDYRIVTAEGKDLGLIPSPIQPAATALSLIHSDRTAHPSVIFRRESALSVGLYRQEDFPCEDLSLWFRLATIGELVSIPSDELIYSLRKTSVSGSRYFEAKSKSVEILLASGQIEDFIAHAIDDFDATLKSYKGVNLGIERSLLFLRDFFHPIVFKELNNLQRIQILVRFFGFLLYPVNTWKLIVLYLAHKKRQQYRNSN